MNLLRLNMSKKPLRTFSIPLVLFGLSLSTLALLKTYFVVKQRMNFKTFLFDFYNRKEYILN